MSPTPSFAALRRALIALPLLVLAACAGSPEAERAAPWAGLTLDRETRAMYASRRDGDFIVPAIPARYLTPRNVRQLVPYRTDHPAGTIVVDPWQKFLYLVEEGGQAIRYRIGVGEAGRQFSGRARVALKREWPTWTPTSRMIRDEPELYEPWAAGMEGGLQNPLGARAMYLYRGGRDTLYRIHGTYAPWSIGRAVSAGCIRLFNQDAIHLYERVEEGTRVVVLTEAESGQGTVSETSEIPVLVMGGGPA